MNDREKKKLTKAQVIDKYENLKIDTQRRIAEKNEEMRSLKIGTVQLHHAMDMVMADLITTCGVKQDDGKTYLLTVWKADKAYKIDVAETMTDGDVVTGHIYRATEVTDETEVQEHQDND